MRAISALALATMCLMSVGCTCHRGKTPLRVTGIFPAYSSNERIRIADTPSGFRHDGAIRYVNLLLELPPSVGMDQIPRATLQTAGSSTQVHLPLTLQGTMPTSHPDLDTAPRRTLIYSGPAPLTVKQHDTLELSIERSDTAETGDMYYELMIVD